MTSFEKLLWGDGADPRRELAELFPDDTGTAVLRAREWARGVIADAGVDAAEELRVIRLLRDAEPRLSLKPARYLAARLQD